MDADAGLRVCLFLGVAAVPQLVARRLGTFEAEGLDVEIIPTRSSDELMGGLLDGSFDVVHANPDNFIAWSDRTGIAIPAWVGGAIGPLKLVADPAVASIEDLRGRTIAVDAVTSGWVPILRRILAAGGLGPADYELRPSGTTRYMHQAVVDGVAAASMESITWWLKAQDSGFAILGDHRTVLPRAQGSAGASLDRWLEQNRDVARSYLRAIVAATTWMYLPANRTALVAEVASGLELSEPHARAVVAELLDPIGGWPPSAMIDAVGMDNVHALRAETEAPPTSPASAYWTDGPYRDAFSFSSDF